MTPPEPMIKGQLVSGDFSSIAMRIKSHHTVELGELMVVEDSRVGDSQEKFILQVYDLQYGSQISEQNLEMVAGMNLEEGNFSLMDESLRNYQLALLKSVVTVSNVGKAEAAEGITGGASAEATSSAISKTCKRLPPFFAKVREITKEDLSFITTPQHPLYLGKLRSGSKEMDFDIFLPGKEVLCHHVLIPASTGKGKSNLMSTMLWDLTGKDFCGLLVLDPHDEYYGRTGLGLKDHYNKQKICYYTPSNPPPGSFTLKINLSKLKPDHFHGAIHLSDPQRQCLQAYYRKFKEQWIRSIIEEKKIEGVSFHEDTIAVVKRKLIGLLALELDAGTLYCQGIFDDVAGENTVNDICRGLEEGKIVIIDTSYFSGALEILVGSLITTEIFEKYKYYKKNGLLEGKPVVSVVLEEAPRVLGTKVLEQGTNIFETIAREGRKFKVGLIAITQLPSEIPKSILANMNTKIILGLEMNAERQAVIDSSPQDLSQDSRTIASLDKGEALISSTFTRFAVPVKIPLFNEFVKGNKVEKSYRMELGGISLE